MPSSFFNYKLDETTNLLPMGVNATMELQTGMLSTLAEYRRQLDMNMTSICYGNIFMKFLV